MTILLGLLLLLAITGCIYLGLMWLRERHASRSYAVDADAMRASALAQRQALEEELKQLRAQVSRLTKWTTVADADDEAQRILLEARAILEQAEKDAEILVNNAEQQYQESISNAQAEAAHTTADARQKAKDLTDQAQAALSTATEQSAQVIADAHRKAEDIAGKAYDVVRNADLYERTAK